MLLRAWFGLHGLLFLKTGCIMMHLHPFRQSFEQNIELDHSKVFRLVQAPVSTRPQGFGGRRTGFAGTRPGPVGQ